MPHIIIKLWPGRSENQKKELASKIVRDVAETAVCDESSVSVAFEEIPQNEWVEKVFEPEIINKHENLYIKPGYDPSKWNLNK